jgi:hypothetical protein
MARSALVVRYDPLGNTISFPAKINSFVVPHFASAINLWKSKKRYTPLFIDFSGVSSPYSNGMLPVISIISKLRLDGYDVRIRLPNDQKVSELFKRTNWAYFLNQDFGRSKSVNDRHLHTRQFRDDKDVATITNDFMDVVLCSMKHIPKDIVSALEWSMYEICDNVINHSESKIGGLVEAVTFSTERRISFTVADAGRGILHSLKEGLPGLKSSVEAIGEAIKAGVTRNKAIGQGNGLAGSLKITTMSGGSLDIVSGAGRIYCTSNSSNELESPPNHFYGGTSVSGHIVMNDNFSIGEALKFDGIEYIPLNIIDLKYESESDDALMIIMSKETTGVGTRKAGAQLRTKIINLMDSKPGFPVYVDWEGIPVISSSFADEFMGKLYVEIGKEKFNTIVQNQNMETLIRQLLEKAISQRVAQESH